MTITEVEVTTETETRAKLLEAAALELEVHGWCQGSPFDDSGRMCLMGAINRVSDLPGEGYDWLTVGATWDPDWRSEWPNVSDAALLPWAAWNDDPARTIAEVTFVLRWRAAEIRDGL